MENSTEELLKTLKSKPTFQEYIDTDPEFIQKSIKEYLEELLAEKGQEKSRVIKNSGIDRTYAYQIFAGTKIPSRDKMIAIGFALGLTIEEMQKLLKVTNFPMLYVKNKRDSIILFGLEKNVSLLEVNELLYEMKENIIE